MIKEKYISPKLRQKVIDDLRLKEENYWWYKIKRRKLKKENYWWSKINIIVEHQKIINLLDNNQINQLNLEQKIGLK